MSLPISFDTNNFERMVQFLNESNLIESIKEIDYHKTKYQDPSRGHFGALVQSQQDAVEGKPLTHRKIMSWQGLLAREQVAHGHPIEEEEIGHIRSPSLPKNVRVGSHIPPDYSHVPTLFTNLIEKINEGLKDQEKLKDDSEYCKFLATTFFEFQKIHPFADGNGRTGRLIAIYIATFCKRPIIIFDSEMIKRNRYYDAHKSPEDMTRFIAGKIQEVVFGLNNKLLVKKDQLSGATSLYQTEDGQYQEKYEWHVLEPLLRAKEESKPLPQKRKRDSSDNSLKSNSNDEKKS